MPGWSAMKRERMLSEIADAADVKKALEAAGLMLNLSETARAMYSAADDRAIGPSDSATRSA